MNIATFIAGPYHMVFEAASTIFEADFWARFSRKKIGHGFQGPYSLFIQFIHTVRTVAQKSRQKTGKKSVFDFCCSTRKSGQKFIFRVEISWFDIFCVLL